MVAAGTLGVTANTEDCIEWDRALDKDGYGHIRIGKRTVGIHRAVWEEERGPIPKGLCVLHRCDNPPCINIDHLFLGTLADNAIDAILKKRHHSCTVTQSFSDYSSKKTHCPRGHALRHPNLKMYEWEHFGWRVCAECGKQFQRRRRERMAQSDGTSQR